MGSVLALASAVLFAGATLLVRQGLRDSTPTTPTLISIATNLVALWLLAAASGGLVQITLPAAATLLLAGIFAPALARLTYYESLTIIGVARAATVGNTTPIFTAILAVPVLGEHLTWRPGASTLQLGPDRVSLRSGPVPLPLHPPAVSASRSRT